MKWIVQPQEEGLSLLTFISQKASGSSRKQLRFAIEHNGCRYNGAIERFCSRKVARGDRVELESIAMPSLAFEKERVLYEDEELIAYNKPTALPSEELAKLGRCYLVHRLDRDTTGVILLAKSLSMQKAIEELFRTRQIEKEYVAYVHGVPKQEGGVIENFLRVKRRLPGSVTWEVAPQEQGKWASTRWQVEKRGVHTTRLRLWPLTGRTHQLRVHLAHLGFPIVGDAHYGDRAKGHAGRPLLHAERLTFTHPQTGQILSLYAPPSLDLESFSDLS